MPVFALSLCVENLASGCHVVRTFVGCSDWYVAYMVIFFLWNVVTAENLSILSQSFFVLCGEGACHCKSADATSRSSATVRGRMHHPFNRSQAFKGNLHEPVMNPLVLGKHPCVQFPADRIDPESHD